MPLSALALVLLAGLLHALWNVAAKKAGGDARFAAFSGIVMIVVWAPIGLWFGWRELPQWGAAQWLLLGASAALHTCYFLILLRGYRVADLTVVYPLARGSGPLLSSAIAVMFLGEHLSALGAAGIGAVVLGVLLIAGGARLLRRSVTTTREPAQSARIRAGIGWGLLTGLFIAAYTVVDGYGVKFLVMSPILLDYLGSWLRTGFMLPALLADRPRCAPVVAAAMEIRAGGRRRKPDRLCARAVCDAARATVACGARARGVDAVCRAARRPVAGRGRPARAARGRSADRSRCGGSGAGLIDTRQSCINAMKKVAISEGSMCANCQVPDDSVPV